jgi:hypothetical protein
LRKTFVKNEPQIINEIVKKSSREPSAFSICYRNQAEAIGEPLAGLIKMKVQRNLLREDVDEPAYIWGDGSSIRCRVVNVSAEGAAIDVPNAAHLSPRFQLMTENDAHSPQLPDCLDDAKSGRRYF